MLCHHSRHCSQNGGLDGFIRAKDGLQVRSCVSSRNVTYDIYARIGGNDRVQFLSVGGLCSVHIQRLAVAQGMIPMHVDGYLKAFELNKKGPHFYIEISDVAGGGEIVVSGGITSVSVRCSGNNNKLYVAILACAGI